ncbi:uncharacterized protein LOC134530864 [Bacillus rossius redtenbacheri]|uniref:uncharacterized protein LOC134530864 n=1 Tax=Bacillus rossius redtenbacheri TaxID=93214 RepID=UPI002FDCE29A
MAGRRYRASQQLRFLEGAVCTTYRLGSGTGRIMYRTCAVLVCCGLLAVPSSGARLQEKCRYDSDCLTDLTYCKNQVECACKVGYEPLESLSGCQAGECLSCLLPARLLFYYW